MNTEIKLKKTNNMNLLLSDMGFKMPICYRESETRVEPAHIHNCSEIYVNISGDVSFLVESTLYPLKSGDVIITKPHEMHHCVYNSSSIHKCYCMWFDANDICSDITQLFFEREKGHNNLITMNSSDKESLFFHWDNMYKHSDANNMDSTSFLASLYSVFEIIYRNKSNKNSANIPDLLGEILLFIDENLSANCNTENIVKNFYISRSSLYRLFNEHLAITPAKYIEEKRLSLSKTLINEKVPLKEVCSACGFNDYSYFISVFKKKFDITPYKYLKSIL